MASPNLEFENVGGFLEVEAYDNEVCITCQTRGSYDFGKYYLNKSEVQEVIELLQAWKDNQQKK